MEENWRKSQKILFQCHFLYNKSHIKPSGIGLVVSQWKTSAYLPETWHDPPHHTVVWFYTAPIYDMITKFHLFPLNCTEIFCEVPKIFAVHLIMIMGISRFSDEHTVTWYKISTGNTMVLVCQMFQNSTGTCTFQKPASVIPYQHTLCFTTIWQKNSNCLLLKQDPNFFQSK
jgi:hypothetical protein